MATILVIDDDQPLVDMLAESLEIDGYRTIKGYDGQMALQLAHSRSPDLIILDLNMPLSNGIEALKRLRADARTFDLPVIILTGEATATFYPMLNSQPRTAYLKKPIDLEELHSLVRHFLKSYPRVAEIRRR